MTYELAETISANFLQNKKTIVCDCKKLSALNYSCQIASSWKNNHN